MPFLQRESLRIYWESSGQGAPVAFLNGVLMTVDSWKLQTHEVSRRFRCVMHDFRGQLRSSKPDEPWTLEDHARDFKALLDHLGIERCHIVGTSYGGEVAMIFAAAWPERVRSLTVIASVSELGPDTEGIVRDWRRAALEAPMSLYRIMLPTTFSPGFIAANPGLVELGEARLQSCDEDFFRAFAGLIDAFCALDISPLLVRIRCPALIIAGEKDRLKPPRYSQIIADGIVDSRLLVAPGAGHAVVLEQPGWVNGELMDFMERH
jgi:3-oxoadipate enol-lactonase